MRRGAHPAENREAVARNLGLPSSARPKALARRCTRSRGALAGGGFVECCQHTNCCQHAHTQSCEHIVLVNPGTHCSREPRRTGCRAAVTTGGFYGDVFVRRQQRQLPALELDLSAHRGNRLERLEIGSGKRLEMDRRKRLETDTRENGWR